MSKVDLKLDWCSHAAAKYAVEHWHYSKRMPIGKMVKIGVWEQQQFIGAILFARGNTPTLGDRYGLKMTEVCELVRVALTQHLTPVSRIVAIALRYLKSRCPDLRLVISFADPAYGHNGAIYQAGNWIYSGQSEPSWQWLHEGRWKHNREITSGAFGGKRKVTNYAILPKRLPLGKYRYLMPLDEAMRKQIEPLRKPYPKRETMETRAESITADALAIHAGEDGAAPISALTQKC